MRCIYEVRSRDFFSRKSALIGQLQTQTNLRPIRELLTYFSSRILEASFRVIFCGTVLNKLFIQISNYPCIIFSLCALPIRDISHERKIRTELTKVFGEVDLFDAGIKNVFVYLK